MAVAALLVTGLSAAPPASASASRPGDAGTSTPATASPATWTGLGLTTPRSLVVEPTTGRVFVAGDDRVVVLAADGTQIGSIPGIAGAYGMDVAQGYVWVNESTADTIAKIDPTTMAVAATFVVGATVGDNLAIVGDGAWIGSRGWTGLQRFDLVTSALTSTGNYFSPAAERIPGSTSELLLYERENSGGTLHRISASPPHAAAATGLSGTYLNAGSVAINDAGTRVWTPVRAANVSTLARTGTTYVADQFAGRLAWSPGHGGLLAVIEGLSTKSIHVYKDDVPSPVAQVSIGNIPDSTPIALSADGDRAYLLTSGVQVVDLRPTIASVTPSGAVRNVPTVVTVTGAALGGTTSVSVGGVTATPLGSSPGQVTFALPAGVPVGSQTLTLSGPTGSVSSTLMVAVNSGAGIHGTVRIRSTAVPAQLTLTGGPLTSPLVVTAGGDGSYSFAGLGYGTTYALMIHDPAAGAPDQTIRALTLTPNVSVARDIDLARPASSGAEIQRSVIGTGTVRDLVVDPGTGDVVVAVGDEIDVLDGEGAALARFRGQYGVHALTLLGPDVYAGVAGSGRIVRINLPSLAVTGSWTLSTPTSGAIAAAAGKIWFVVGDPAGGQFAQLASLDPTTGAIGASSGTWFNPVLRSVQGAPARFTVTEPYISNDATLLYDGTAVTPTEITRTDTFTQDFPPSPPFVSVTASGRIYDASGREFTLSDLVADGTRYAGSGFPAYSPGHGGTVAFGSTVSKQGNPISSHDFGSSPTTTGLNAAGSRLYTTVGNQLVVDDLAPIVTTVSPAVVHPATSDVLLYGSGLGVVKHVTIDGTAVPFSLGNPGLIGVSLSSPAAGMHLIVVSTPWGASVPIPLLVNPLSAPASPPAPSVTYSGGNAHVAFQPPSDDGGVPITSYTVTASPGGATCSSGGTFSCDVPGLLPSTSYTFTVTATNSIGTGPPSAPSYALFVPPNVVPGAPTNVVATAGPGNVHLTWTAPVFAGGLQLSGYTIAATKGDSTPVLPTMFLNGSTPGVTYSGLIPGESYTFTISASNSVGAGPSSPDTTAVVVLPLLVAPSAPLSVSAVAGDGSATVSWSAPVSDGGSPLVAYIVEAPGSEGCLAAPSTLSCTVPDLTNGVPYTFTVFAHNVVGDSPASIPSAPVTPSMVVPPASTFHPLAPVRIVDSRPGGSHVGALNAWGPGASQDVPVTGGLSGVPSTATAVVLNVTATGGTANGDYLSIWPTGTVRPNVSSLNVNAGQTIANQVTVKLGSGFDAGKVSVFNAGGTQHVIVDVAGYYDTVPGGDGFTSLSPVRITDSRPGGAHVGPLGPWVGATTQTVTVSGGLSGVPSDADAVVLNVTATGGTANGDYLSVWPAGGIQPTASSINMGAGQTIANAVTVKLGSGAGAGKVSIFNAGGTQNVIVDVVGYFEAGSGKAFYAHAPARIIDSRPGATHVGPLGAWVGAVNQTVSVTGDLAAVPSDADSVVMNVTATGGTANGDYFSIWPAGTTQPMVSSLNFGAGETIANAVTVKVGSGGAAGKISVFNAGGTVNAIIDIAGYYA